MYLQKEIPIIGMSNPIQDLIEYDDVCVVVLNTVIRIWEYVDVVIFDIVQV